MKYNFKTITFLCLLMSLSSFAQTKYALVPETTEVRVDGESTISAWSVAINETQCSFTLVDSLNIEVGAALYSEMAFQFAVAKMESGRGPIMNDKVNVALKSDKYPIVRFTSTENEIISIERDTFMLQSTGMVEVAGQNKPLEVIVKCSCDTEQSTVSVQGNKELKFSTYDIKKPEAFFGQLQTMDDINVVFKINFTKQQ